MTNNIDLLIIGSGISGLSAYLEAKKKKINNILIIDKGFHVGGRICSKNLNNIYFNHGAPFICRSKIKKSLSFFNLLKHNKNISRTVIKNIYNKSQIVYYPSPMMRSFFDDFNNNVIIKQKTKAINVEKDGNLQKIAVKKVILAASSLNTPKILLNSGYKNKHLGQHLKLHPVSGVAGKFSEEQKPWAGTMQGIYSDDNLFMKDNYGYLLEGLPMHPSLFFPFFRCTFIFPNFYLFFASGTSIAITCYRICFTYANTR